MATTEAYERAKMAPSGANGHARGDDKASNGAPSNGTTTGGTAKYPTGAYGPLEEVPSIIEIKRILPKHCFESDLRRSMYYVFKDLAMVMGLYLAICLVEYQPYQSLRLVATPVYCFLQGTLMWSMFVLGHDCGHGSFSKYPVINDAVGTLLHAAILVPYYPWKLSHHHHHKNTGNIDKDEIFYPCRERYWAKDYKPIEPAFGFGASWFAYLWSGYYPRKVNHLNPFEPMFAAHFLGCCLSLGAIVAWGTLLFKYWMAYGLLALVLHYGLPVFVFASWLVLVTFLHHTEVGVAWYSDERWNYVRGQLSSVDRNYGWAHDLTHNIGTHQVHHLFIKIPHYHLEEATQHFRRVYPHLVRQNQQPIITSFFRMFRIFNDQRHVRDTTAVHTYAPIKTT